MDIHEHFTEWATEKGVEINGIRPHRFEGRGLGIIAEKDLKVRAISFTMRFYNIYLVASSRGFLYYDVLFSSHCFKVIYRMLLLS